MMRDVRRSAYDLAMHVTTRRDRWPMWATDTILALVLTALAVVSLASLGPEDQATYDRAVDAWAYVLVLAQTLPLALRRVYPVPVLLIVVAAFFIDRGLDYPATIASVGFAFAFHSLGSQLPPQRSLRIGLPIIGLLTLFTISGVFANESVTWATVFVVALATTAPLMLGREVYEKRRYLSELEAKAESADRDREEAERRAVRRERARIARELHDVVAHEMTVMTVQAAAARRVLDRRPDEAAQALAAIEDAGHDALTEMRRLLGLLRTDRTDPEFTPQPGLGRLEGLVDQMRDAGLDVAVAIDGEPCQLPAGVDLNAYRIVQESLTNTLKHGGPSATARVHIRFSPDDVAIDVEDDGRGAADALAKGDDTGHGILGMQERVAMLDGEFVAGPRAGGGYRVHVRLPIGAS
jgi:signal transduction histidine kinase